MKLINFLIGIMFFGNVIVTVGGDHNNLVPPSKYAPSHVSRTITIAPKSQVSTKKPEDLAQYVIDTAFLRHNEEGESRPSPFNDVVSDYVRKVQNNNPSEFAHLTEAVEESPYESRIFVCKAVEEERYEMQKNHLAQLVIFDKEKQKQERWSTCLWVCSGLLLVEAAAALLMLVIGSNH